jgi:hypothetical protein
MNEVDFIQNHLLKLTNGNKFARNLTDDIGKAKACEVYHKAVFRIYSFLLCATAFQLILEITVCNLNDIARHTSLLIF